MDVQAQSKERIISLIKQNKEKIKVLGVQQLGLFGSFVRNAQRPDSDVDMLVKFGEGKKTFDNFMQLSFFLEELLNRRVELVTPESLSPYLRPYIMKELEYVSFAD
jgi:hypothetical protein